MIYFFGNEKLSKLLHEEEPRVLFIFESMEYFFSHFILNFLPIGVKTEITCKNIMLHLASIPR